jgi:hypothetical protein
MASIKKTFEVFNFFFLILGGCVRYYGFFFWCAVYRNNFLFHTLFTSLHVSASTGHPQVKYTQSFLKAITPTTEPFLCYTVHYFKLCYIVQLKFDVKIVDNVLKIAILYIVYLLYIIYLFYFIYI